MILRLDLKRKFVPYHCNGFSGGWGRGGPRIPCELWWHPKIFFHQDKLLT